jgi:hypothetical protein
MLSGERSHDWNTFLFLQLPCLPVTIPPLNLKPTPEVESAVDTLINVSVLSKERMSKFLILPLLVAATNGTFS